MNCSRKATIGIHTHVDVDSSNPSVIAAVGAGVSSQVVVEHFLLSPTSQCGGGVSGDESFQSPLESQSDDAVDLVKGSKVTLSQGVRKKRVRRRLGVHASFLGDDAALAEAAAESAAAFSRLEAECETWQEVDRLQIKCSGGHQPRAFITRDLEQRCGCCGLLIQCGVVALDCMDCEFMNCLARSCGTPLMHD